MDHLSVFLFYKALAEVSQATSNINSLLHDAVFGFIHCAADELEDLHPLVPSFDMHLKQEKKFRRRSKVENI